MKNNYFTKIFFLMLTSSSFLYSQQKQLIAPPPANVLNQVKSSRPLGLTAPEYQKKTASQTTTHNLGTAPKLNFPQTSLSTAPTSKGTYSNLNDAKRVMDAKRIQRGRAEQMEGEQGESKETWWQKEHKEAAKKKEPSWWEKGKKFLDTHSGTILEEGKKLFTNKNESIENKPSTPTSSVKPEEKKSWWDNALDTGKSFISKNETVAKLLGQEAKDLEKAAQDEKEAARVKAEQARIIAGSQPTTPVASGGGGGSSKKTKKRGRSRSPRRRR